MKKKRKRKAARNNNAGKSINFLNLALSLNVILRFNLKSPFSLIFLFIVIIS